jgi:alkylhydroperoxidase/carboxymuconolactone decarboxylase family protein YurZ
MQRDNAGDEHSRHLANIVVAVGGRVENCMQLSGKQFHKLKINMHKQQAVFAGAALNRPNEAVTKAG